MSADMSGPAFPSVRTITDYDYGNDFRYANTYSDGGMSLQQWYAGLAMQGLVASGEYQNGTASWIAQEADAIATAMLTRVGDKA